MINLKKLSVLVGIYAGGLSFLCSLTNLSGYIETRNMLNRIDKESRSEARTIAETDIDIVDSVPKYIFFYGVKKAAEEYLEDR